MHSSQRKQFVQRFCDRKKFSGKVWGTEGQPGSWSIFSKGASNRLHWEDRDGTKQGRARDHGEKFRFYFVCMRSHWKVLSRSSTWCNLCFKNLTSAQLLSISDFLYSPKNGVKKKKKKQTKNSHHRALPRGCWGIIYNVHHNTWLQGQLDQCWIDLNCSITIWTHIISHKTCHTYVRFYQHHHFPKAQTSSQEQVR